MRPYEKVDLKPGEFKVLTDMVVMRSSRTDVLQQIGHKVGNQATCHAGEVNYLASLQENYNRRFAANLIDEVIKDHSH